MASKSSSLWRSFKCYQIYGANTDVGKTIMSTILCKAFGQRSPSETTWYLKPVSTGPLEEADDRHITRFAPQTKTKCLFQFGEAVSPHIAARSSKPLSDAEIQKQVLGHLISCAKNGPGTVLLETAGGVHSPTPSGSSQADLYRPLRLPIFLVADHRLGGISASISAFESLHIRGYDMDAVLQFQDLKYQNHSYLQSYFAEKGVLSLSIPLPPPRLPNSAEDQESMLEYYSQISGLDTVEEVLSLLSQKHTSRIEKLENMSTKAHSQIWYPFTQHREVSPSTIMTIDSASGDFFQTHTIAAPNIEKEEEILTPTFDGSASWWTQGLGHGNPTLSLAAAYAAGRYGHVMFAGTIHEPALELASTLLKNLDNPRLSKVFYSDNGSTGIEVATKMALTATAKRYGWEDKKEEIGVIGLQGSYHGDTIGAMDLSEPSTYNEKVHWYKGRGYWFDFPQVKMVKGKWRVELCEEIVGKPGMVEEYESLGNIFDLKTRWQTKTALTYMAYIAHTLMALVQEKGMRFGALIMEPVILGAGGMLFADPLFQHILVHMIRAHPKLIADSAETSTNVNTWSGLPVIHDEVFTGLYRLGRFSSSTFIHTHPDIGVHAKLLTGGLIPLCTTVASDSIYEAFMGDEKRDALLHGHSYTAHPVGCHVANESLKAMMRMEERGEWQVYKDDWNQSAPSPSIAKSEEMGDNCGAWSVWSKDFITNISLSPDVESVITLGSVLAINLKDEHAGYTSTAASGLQKRLLEGNGEFKIHVRVLGNVLYMMASQTSKVETLRGIEKLLLNTLLWRPV